MAENQHGGARPRAGRKPKAERFESQISQAEQRAADRLPQLVDKLLEAALDGFERVHDTYEPAGTIQIDRVETSEGKAIRTKELAFPRLPPEQLVLTRRTITRTAPDRDAAKYLINRVAGSPVQQIEATVEQKAIVPDSLEAAMIAAYGTPEDPDDAEGAQDDESEDFAPDGEGDSGEG